MAGAAPRYSAALPLLGLALLSGQSALAQQQPQASEAQAPQSAPAPQQAPAQPQLPTGQINPFTTAPLSGEAKPKPAPEPRVQIAEVVVAGLEGHPEQERLELAAYAAMAVTPGSRVTRSELQTDLSAIYATGWFSDVRIQPVDSPLGVRLVVTVVANPVLEKITLDPADAKVPGQVVNEIFSPDFGRTLNLNTLQLRMQEMQKWYADQGYSLARVTGPTRVNPDGTVELLVRQGTVAGVEVKFVNKEGSESNDKGQPIKGKTKPWVISREISLKPGDVFNRRNLEEDIKRLYGTGLFSDVKVTLQPIPADPGTVTIVLGIVEQSTGSLSGGLGYSGAQGIFGQIQLNDSNLRGRAWDFGANITYGQYGGLIDLTFTDPWIKGDPFRTAFRGRGFISRDIPQSFQNSDTGAAILTANNSNIVAIQRAGVNLQFVRPMNGGDPFRKAPWALILGLSGQQAVPMNFAGQGSTFGTINGNTICLAYNCASSNNLWGIRLATTMNRLNDSRNPTKGDFLSLSTEQFLPLGNNSPGFNRLRAGYTFYIPVEWLKVYKGCRPKPGDTKDCKQAWAFQVSAGTNIGEIPPYEAFCLGGGNSVRGYYDCALGSGRSFVEATIEYRFPIFSIISGEVFVDGGSALGTQNLGGLYGNPAALLGKPGNGFSVGTGLIVTTPVGPLRLEIASQDFTGQWRFNLGVGWKF
ncbi:MAG: BamA/TamA family outer membrane protein [Cyanobacteriota bacterium]|nr:BamA/TamA family outer membrane protein [Cyanobacteriota bacterium]